MGALRRVHGVTSTLVLPVDVSILTSVSGRGRAVFTFVIAALYPVFRNEAALDQFTSENSTGAALLSVSGSLTPELGCLDRGDVVVGGCCGIRPTRRRVIR
ncbi:hypothetical protein CVN56_31200 [Rhodococcus sp. AQ5-07]|nr:hypothetical protein CVN56_31200 [Rhodococcus sp. AQ5-07]